MTGVACLIAVKNIFEDGTVCYRYLKSKSKITSPDITTVPRSETSAALICARMLNLLKFDLLDNIKEYEGEMEIRCIGDSMVVLESLLIFVQHEFKLFAGSCEEELGAFWSSHGACVSLTD